MAGRSGGLIREPTTLTRYFKNPLARSQFVNVFGHSDNAGSCIGKPAP